MISSNWQLLTFTRVKLKSNKLRFRRFLGLCCLSIGLMLAACATPPPQFVSEEPVEVVLIADGESQRLITETNSVREVLDEAGVSLGDADLIEPPLFTPLTDGMEISIIRVTESVEVIEQSLPFQRRSVRNESMSEDSPPIIVQSGRTGLQEITLRIVYHDGLEFSRQQTKLTVIEPTQDEIVMIGVGSSPGDVDFAGQLAFINGGNSVIFRGSTAFAEQLDTGGDLDHRVFSLSPSGNHLLYTRVSTETDTFNTLWVINTIPNAEPQDLGIDNVLWADWNPDRVDEPQIAFTTGIPTELLPGWEANNDLWIGDMPQGATARFRPEKIVEAYPATYGWWGGNFAWSPSGQYIAYSHADEVGVIDIESEEENNRTQLQTFPEYNTRADWVWVPSLSWSPDSQFLAFTKHVSTDPIVAEFDTWVVNVESGLARPMAEGSGIWGHPRWSPIPGMFDQSGEGSSKIAFLKANNPVESQSSSYTLWLMDRDGSNAQQLYPAAGENSRFPREQSFMTWGPTGTEIAFVYNDDLYIYNLDDNVARQVTRDDNIISNPTWAPYGRATFEEQDQDQEQDQELEEKTPVPSTRIPGRVDAP